MGYRGAGLPFHSSWQGLSRARRDPRRQPGPSCLPCTCPGSGCAARPRGASSRRVGGVSPEQEGSKGQRGLGGQEHRQWGKVRACQGSCQAPADPALAAALRPLPHARNRSPGACGAFLPLVCSPTALSGCQLWPKSRILSLAQRMAIAHHPRAVCGCWLSPGFGQGLAGGATGFR